MIKIKMVIELEYDDKLMHDTDQEAVDWFNNDILLGKKGKLLLHSNEIGDSVGSVVGLEILTA